MKKSQKVGSYIIEKEGDYLKIRHENKTFNIRIFAGMDIEVIFEQLKDKEYVDYYAIVFAAVNTISLLAFQSPDYFQKWLKFHNEYFDALGKVMTEEQDAEIINDEQLLKSMEESGESK